MTDGPHQNQPIERAGAPLEDASAAMILVHGRGARATGMLDLAREIDRDDVAFLAPQARRGTWYPNSFLAPIESNQPGLDSGLAVIERLLETAAEAGVPAERTILLGFSQGACLATEFAGRNARRYGGVVALSGGLIGPEVERDRYGDSMDGTPVFFGCDANDPHIPEERVHESADVFEDRDADVTTRIYQGVGHTVVPDELEHVRNLVDEVADRG